MVDEPVPTETMMLSAQPASGTMLGSRYRLLERIGRGGMADVFAAEDVLLNRQVAIKIFRFEVITAEDLRRVQAEMQTLAVLHHPGLVTIYDAGAIHDPIDTGELASPYLVMELVAGPTLRRRLADGALPPAEVALLGGQLADTLAYVHSKNVVHRDVKPANILLGSALAGDAPFTAKLTDFGIARMVDSTHYTEAGYTIGTANYLSPEQALSTEVGTATDVYSLGLVLLECLTGELAFPGTGVEAALARLNRRPAVTGRFGPRWQRLLSAATESDPGDRPTVAELAAELHELATVETPLVAGPAEPSAAGPVPPLVAASPDRRRHATAEAFTQAWLFDGQAAENTADAGTSGPGSESDIGAVALAGRTGRRHRRPGLLAAAAAVAAVLATSGFLVRGVHLGGQPGSTSSPAAQTSSVRHSPASSASHQAAVAALASTAPSSGVSAARTTAVSTHTPPSSTAPTTTAPPPPPKAGPTAPAPGPGRPKGHGKGHKH